VKIISLLPAATELLVQLSCTESLIACTHTCDLSKIHPKPQVITKSNIPAQDSLGIDKEVKQLKQIESPIIFIDEAFIIREKPDLIIAQTLCDVCAIDAKSLQNRLKAKGIEIPFVEFKVDSIQDFLATAHEIGTMLNAPNLEEVIEDWQTRLDIVEHKIKLVKNRETLLFLEWTNPLMVAGHWNVELVSKAGALPVLSKAQQASFYIDFQELMDANPEIILIAPCGFSLAQTLSAVGELSMNPDWQNLKAVQNKKVFVADGDRYFNNPGPALIDSVEILAEIIQANTFYFGFEQEAWVNLYN
jgi:iron complex transport system substrate-binding protein